MFTQRGNTEDDGGETKEENQKSQRNQDHITCIECEKRPLCGQYLIPHPRKSQGGCRGIQEDKTRKYGKNCLMTEEEKKYW